MADIIDFRPYLESLRNDDKLRQSWDCYTQTDAIALMVQTVSAKQAGEVPTQEHEKIEKLLVLLSGKPGSGKSTALARLLWEEAQTSLELAKQGQEKFPIPILIELRDCRSGSVLNWIQKSLPRPRPSHETIENLLIAKRFLLLFDGLNEVPSSDAWTELESFLRDPDFRATPMIFTTRELGTGADLGIEKKLEMVPLTEPQMREFIQKRLPGQADNLLRQLQGRLRELAETPLLLKILCDVVRESPDGQIPTNRGELFRKEFARRYEKFKPARTLPITDDSRRFASELLQYLAFVMIQGNPHTDPCKPTPSWLTIPKTKAEQILETFLTGRVGAPAQAAKEWLEDLLEFHLLQVASDPGRIEFHHQLFQEYYAAEYLLNEISKHSEWLEKLPGQNYTRFQQEYLNLLKWTESLAMMMALADEVLAVQIVELALEVDLNLGARLAGEVKPAVQEQTVSLIERREISDILKIECFGKTRSSHAVSFLKGFLKYDQPQIYHKAFEALSEIRNEESIDLLSQALEHKDYWLSSWVVSFLGNLGRTSDTSKIINALKNKEARTREYAATALGKIGDKTAILPLLQALEDKSPKVRWSAACALAKIEDKTIFDHLNQLLRDSDYHIRKYAAIVLGKKNKQEAIPVLKEALLKDRDFQVISSSITALAAIKNEAAIHALVDVYLNQEEPFFRQAIFLHLKDENCEDLIIPILITALKNEKFSVRAYTAEALGKFGNATVIPSLIQALQDDEPEVCWAATIALGNIEDDSVVPILINALNETDPVKQWSAAIALGNLKRTEALPALEEIARYACHQTCYQAIRALGKIADDRAIQILSQLLEDEDHEIRHKAIYELSQINNQNVISELSKALDHEDSTVCEIAARALGRVGQESGIPSLIQALQHENFQVCGAAAEALGEIGSSIAISHLYQVLGRECNSFHSHIVYPKVVEALRKIGQFYNYEIAQSAIMESEARSQKSTGLLDTVNAIHEKVEAMSETPANDFSGAQFNAPVNFAPNYGNQAQTQNIYSQEQNFEILLADYKQFVSELQQKYPQASDEKATQIIDAEFKALPSSQPIRWQNFLNLKRLWNGGKKAAIKVGEHFVEENPWGKGAIAFLEGVSDEAK